MQFHVAQLMKEHTGTTRRFELNEEIRHLAAEDMTIETPLTGVVTLMKDTEGILVTGKLKVQVSVPCVRCLEPVSVPLEMELEEQYYPTIDIESGRRISTPEDADADTLINGRHILDITELVRQSLVLDAPMHPIHPYDCAPVSEDEETQDSPATPSDPRWAALQALRDQK